MIRTSNAFKKQTKQKQAIQYQLHLAMLDSLRNAPNGEWQADLLWQQICARGLDPRLIDRGTVAALTRSFAKAGYLQLINNKFHQSTRHGGNLVNVWKVLPKTIPKVDWFTKGHFLIWQDALQIHNVGTHKTVVSCAKTLVKCWILRLTVGCALEGLYKAGFWVLSLW